MSLLRADQLSQPVVLREGSTRLGNTPECDSWIEGCVSQPVGPVQFDVNGRVHCRPLAGARVEVNGRLVSEACLYDGDELTVDSIPFLVVSLPVNVRERNSHAVQ